MGRNQAIVILSATFCLYGAIAVAGELHEAAQRGDSNRVVVLLAQGRSVNELDAQGFSPLAHATFQTIHR